MSLLECTYISHSLHTVKALKLKDCISLVFIHSLSEFISHADGNFLKALEWKMGL